MCVAVLGFGAQGGPHAQNLRDSGLSVLVAQRPGGRRLDEAVAAPRNLRDDSSAARSRHDDSAVARNRHDEAVAAPRSRFDEAVAAGFSPLSIADAVSRADLIIFALPDETAPAIFDAEIRPHLRPGQTLGFIHGYNIHYCRIVPPPDVSVVMVAPKAQGRAEFLAGRGVAALIAVHQNATPSEPRPEGRGSELRPEGRGSELRPEGMGLSAARDTSPPTSASDPRPEESGSEPRPEGRGSEPRPGKRGSESQLEGRRLAFPKTSAHGASPVRAEFLAGRGVPGLIAVAHDASGCARQSALAWAAGLGCHRAAIFETTFKDETETDLFGEQAVLCGGVTSLIKAAFDTLTDAGYPPVLAYFECCHELKLLVDLIHEGGITYMRERISNTARYGDLTRGPRIIDDHVRAEMRKILAEIQSGAFAAEWAAESTAVVPSNSADSISAASAAPASAETAAGLTAQNVGAPPQFAALTDRDRTHPLELVGQRLRDLMNRPTTP